MRLAAALAAWEIQAHRTLANQPEPADLLGEHADLLGVFAEPPGSARFRSIIRIEEVDHDEPNTSAAARQWTACTSTELAQPDLGASSAVDPGVPASTPWTALELIMKTIRGDGLPKINYAGWNCCSHHHRRCHDRCSLHLTHGTQGWSSNPPPTKQNPVPFVAGGPLVRERSSFIRLCDKRIQPLCKVSRPFRANPRVQPQSR